MITDEQVIAAIAEFYKSGTGNGGMRKALEAYEASKPKPEPVAWLVRRNGYENVTVSLSKDKAISYRHEVQMRSDLSGDLNEYRIEPLYTTPPTREPLSDYEMPVGRMMVNGVLLSPDCTTAFILGVRFAEQKHGIGEKQ